MSESDRIQARETIDEQYKWDISSFYKSEEEWRKEFEKVQLLLKEVEQYRGKLNQSSTLFKEFIILREKIIIGMGRLYTYSKMRWDENTKINKIKSMFDQAQNLSTEVERVLSFLEPELLKDLDTFLRFITTDEKLSEYKRYFAQLKEQQQHILSDKEEKIISEAGAMAQGPENIFSVLSDSDLTFPIIKDDNGEEKRLSHGRFIRFMESYNRDVRKQAFEAMYNTYRKYINTYSSILNAHLKTDVFNTRVRNYSSSLEAALKPNEIPVEVYTNLIDTVNKSLPLLQRYLKLRKKQLKLDSLEMYDLYVPIIPDIDFNVTYEEACDIILKSLEPLGTEYTDVVRECFEQRWVDVFENDGKRSGAYSWGSYNTYPYILMNYQNNLNSLFTLTHEIGHSVHSYFSKKRQPFATSDYVIFVAEVASTVNETLLFNYLFNNYDDNKFKAYLVNYHLEGYRTTVFRQTLFAEFEKVIHEMIERGDALTSDDFSDIYYKLNEKYYAPTVNINKDIELEWARIPHFYYNYYVYQYATGFSAAQALSKNILNNNQESVSKYIDFLASGSADKPIELLKLAGIDMTSPQAVLTAFESFNEYISALEELL
ncbi:oligoendopeptidase F [Desulfuribacillus alkaliarsenatis]|uniref:Oligopeptidase F n=1 Tax=Desulfuribacillus alkaliarsenatis TaxID=766136 RepID=A0A1E5FZS8_9FIRM|nr:oligoendopeptidase F [Desulfuribacillus alkaliarsenatis]OEF96003.1 oligoendopeptidase F [Desulfuribacillus alkaliarsenatis]